MIPDKELILKLPAYYCQVCSTFCRLPPQREPLMNPLPTPPAHLTVCLETIGTPFNACSGVKQLLWHLHQLEDLTFSHQFTAVSVNGVADGAGTADRTGN